MAVSSTTRSFENRQGKFNFNARYDEATCELIDISEDLTDGVVASISLDTQAGKVDTASINAAGSGYSNGTGVAVTGGSGSGLTLNITVNAGALDTIEIVNPGSGYEAGDTVTVAGGTGGTVDVDTVVTGSGYGYTADLGVSVTGGDGTGLKVDTTVSAGAGIITAVSLNSGGSGYEEDNDNLAISGGTGATLDITVANNTFPISKRQFWSATQEIPMAGMVNRLGLGLICQDTTALAALNALDDGVEVGISGTVYTADNEEFSYGSSKVAISKDSEGFGPVIAMVELPNSPAWTQFDCIVTIPDSVETALGSADLKIGVLYFTS